MSSLTLRALLLQRDVLMYALRTIVAAVISIVLAKIMAERMGPELEEAITKAQKSAAAEASQPSGPFGAEL